MSLLDQAIAGLEEVEVDAAARDAAVRHLTAWLQNEEFSAYRPQLEWLIESRQWPGLMDRFYQVLPFGTGGRRGKVGIGPNRFNAWTLGASIQGHCEYLKEKFPGVSRLHVALAYDVRRFEDRGNNYNPALSNPTLHQTSRDLRGMRPRFMLAMAAMFTPYRQTVCDSWLPPNYRSSFANLGATGG